MASGWGGARPGSGPKKRAPGTRSSLPTPEKAAEEIRHFEAIKRRREIIDRAILGDETSPLEMMLETARALWNSATSGATLDVDQAMQACAMAEKCAPYLHPRLTAAAVRAEVHNAPAAEGQRMTPEEYRLWARQQIREAFGMPPLTIEHHAEPRAEGKADDGTDAAVSVEGCGGRRRG
jgi:hypothetical protein